MATPNPLSLILFFSLLAYSSSSSIQQDPNLVVQDVHRSINESRRNLGYFSCGTGNPIDDCWRCDQSWERNRRRLADCAIGFGRNAIGGRNGRFYLVTDSSDETPHDPKPGTLRYAVIQDEPLWIIFESDMVIKLQHALLINSYKTIDGRGASVHIGDGPCIIIHHVKNIIIHGIHVHDCKEEGSSDGDGISVIGSNHVWIDHLSMSKCYDGLIDVTHGSTAITLSNNHFTHHDKVMLLGHTDSCLEDKKMQVTVAFNHFGVGLVQRMPRCRHGYFHVVNNDYYQWKMYAIGGSANPTINSQGNRFLASDENKEVTKHELASEDEWKHWNWRSEGDLMLNGAYFRESGIGASDIYARASSLSARPASLVGSLTYAAGALTCRSGYLC